MAALFQQLRHVLASWDAVESLELHNSADRQAKLNVGKHKSLFMRTVNTANSEEFVGCDAAREVCGAGVGVPSEEECPPWLHEDEECDCSHGGDFNGACDKMSNDCRDCCGVGDQRAGVVDCAATGTLVDSGLSRRRITKLELARAALALFTSNSGIYRPILQKTLGFLFGLIDELLEETVDVLKGDAAPKNILPLWSPTENEEVAAAHERMRMMELRMAKLVEEAAMQRDHLKAEIVASQARETKLEGLLKHQIILSHARWGPDEGVSLPTGSSGQNDALYVRRLIARAENEKAIDELQKELALVQKERDDLGQEVQKLMDLNGKYAHQCAELAVRLSILADQNIGMAISCEKYQNEVLVEKRRAEKCLQDLQVARNVVIAAFVNRRHVVQTWWESLHEKRLDSAEETFANFLKPIGGVLSALLDESEKEKEKEKGKKDVKSIDGAKEPNKIAPENVSSSEGQIDTNKEVNVLSHLWVSRSGCNPETPMHLRCTSSVEHLSVNPLVVERIVHMLLFEWRKSAEQCSLDNFIYFFIQKLVEKKENPSSSSTSTPTDTVKECAPLNAKCLAIVYAIDTVSRSCCCGSLTYAFGLVSRGHVNKNLFHMLEFDNAVLLSLCRFLDREKKLSTEHSGSISIVQFASILVAMYPSYSLSRLQQLLTAAKNDGGNRLESPLLIYYSTLLPERMLLDSESLSVDNAGALWDTCFVHLLYKFICDDVEDSLQTMEDGFYASSVRHCGVVSESEVLFQAFNAMPDDDRHVWFPAIRAVLASWDEPKVNRVSMALEDKTCVSVHAAVKYLRGVLLLRRGTRMTVQESHINWLTGLQQGWNKCVGGSGKIDIDKYFGLVKCVDEKRDAVWVAVSGLTDEGLREFNISDDVTANAMLMNLLENGEEKT